MRAKLSPEFTNIGAVLIHLSYITQETLQQAVLRQKSTGVKLGECFVEMGAVTRAQLDEALKLQDDLRSGKPEKMLSLLTKQTETYARTTLRVRAAADLSFERRLVKVG